MTSPLATLATLLGVHLLMVMTPGPNSLIVLRNAARDRRLGLASALGVFPVATFWMASGLLGLGALFRAFPSVEVGLSLVCGAYLLWLGAKAWRASLLERRLSTPKAGGAVSFAGAFAEGAITNLTNPKTIAYVSSVFAATGATDMPRGYQFAAIALMPSISLVFYCGLALFASSRPVAALLAGARVWLDRVVGTLMIGFGLRLIAQR